MKSRANILSSISNKKERHIIGLMSGTSVDGLDIALCKFEGFGLETQFQLVSFETIDFPELLRKSILKFLGKRNIDLLELTLLNTEFAQFTADSINSFLARNKVNKDQVDLIASHGQTVFHAPRSFHHFIERPNATLQIGDGDHIAVLTGITTISDFRQKHVAWGGEGAPLALYGDYALFSSKNENRILLNIGGISNFTFLPRDLTTPCWATDVGPGNTILDELCRRHFNCNFDKNGRLASKGKLIPELLSLMNEHPYLAFQDPKSTGQEAFNLSWFDQLISQNTEIIPLDQLCSVTHFTALTIARSINQIDLENCSVYVSGGGANNDFLMSLLRSYLHHHVRLDKFESLGLIGDAKEALLFAFLANESLSPLPLTYPFQPNMLTMGKVSFAL